MISLSMDVDRAGLAAMRRQMQRRMDLLGKTPRAVVRDATFALLGALRSSTRRAKPNRRVVRNPDPNALRFPAHYWAIVRYDRQDKPAYIPVMGGRDNRQAAMDDKRRRVPRRGLAIASWGWMFRPLGRSTSVEHPEKPSAFSVRERAIPGDHEVKLQNRIRYALSAFRSKGRKDVATAMSRAAKTLRIKTEKALAKLK